MGPGPGRALRPGPAAGPGPCSRPRAQGPARARPHVRIYGSYCMYMYISRCYICIYVYFGIPTFSALPFTFSILGFLDSHFQRLALYIFNFVFFMICGVLDPGKLWGIVGNCGLVPLICFLSHKWPPIPSPNLVQLPLDFIFRLGPLATFLTNDMLYTCKYTYIHTHQPPGKPNIFAYFPYSVFFVFVYLFMYYVYVYVYMYIGLSRTYIYGISLYIRRIPLYLGGA